MDLTGSQTGGGVGFRLQAKFEGTAPSPCLWEYSTEQALR